MSLQHIAEEMEQIKNMETREGISVPLPHYFYIQRYGRKIEEQMTDIISKIGKREWFLFRTDSAFRQEGLLRSFLLELEKHAKLGREYQECVVLEFDEDICQQDELYKLFEYLKSREEQFYFLFTMKQTKNTVSIQRCMEQYFFVRTIYAEPYQTDEQLEFIRDACEEYQCGLHEDAVQVLWDGLADKKWEENEFVACNLKNSVYRLIYESAIEGEFKGKRLSLSKDMAMKFLEHLDRKIVEKMAIGFCKGGYSYE